MRYCWTLTLENYEYGVQRVILFFQTYNVFLKKTDIALYQVREGCVIHSASILLFEHFLTKGGSVKEFLSRRGSSFPFHTKVLPTLLSKRGLLKFISEASQLMGYKER